MTESGKPGKPSIVSRQYLLDRRVQLWFSVFVVCIAGGIGLLYAAAVLYLVDTDLLRDQTVADQRLVLMLVHTGYSIIGGAMLLVAVVLLTHRFVGPGLVMRRAVEKLRCGDFSARLSLRRRDYHKDLAEQLRLLRDEMAERDEKRVDTLHRLESALDAGDESQARDLVEELLRGCASERARRAEAAKIVEAAGTAA